MLMVVFKDESKAYEGSRALNRLDAEGSIAIHAEAVLAKNLDGTVTVKQTEGDFPIRTIGGTALGSLVGLLGGPVGLGIGAAAGAIAGSIADLSVVGVGEDFLDEASAALMPGKFAVLADVTEEWITPVDTAIEQLQGVVFRTPKHSFEEEQRARDVAEIRAEIEQLRLEHAKAKADRKAKIQSKIDDLETRLQRKLERSKERLQQVRDETEAKLQALQKKAANAQGEVKATMNARVTELRRQYEAAETKLKTLAAGHAGKTAERSAAAV